MKGCPVGEKALYWLEEEKGKKHQRTIRGNRHHEEIVKMPV